MSAPFVSDNIRFDAAQVRDDFVPKEDYLSSDFVRREAKLLWPRVWQVACREEELTRVGDFVTYDVADESLIVVRNTPITIKAYHNVCSHRGRRLTEECGNVKRLACRFHGWQWDLNGKNLQVVDRTDWGDSLSDQDVHLREAHVATWGGFVFINMQEQPEPLDEFLRPVNELCAKFEFDKLRYRWYRTVVFPCNWKLLLDAFNEAYHVQTTHRQFLDNIEEYSNSGGFGRHGAFWYPPLPEGKSRFTVSSRLKREGHTDYRKYVLGYFEEAHRELGAMVTPRSYEAAQRLLTEVPADASSNVVLAKLREFQREAAQTDGAGWPDLTAEEIVAARQDWHVFPNLIFLHSMIDGVLAYRVRPNGDDPASCKFDVWSLVRYAPGKEPPLKREFFNNWKECNWGRILTQDFQNLAEVQQGMKSSAFRGARTNPVQERVISNFHRRLREFMSPALNAAPNQPTS